MLYSYGITDKVSANIEGYTHVVKNVNYSDLPVITSIINSSGEEYTNSDVAIIVNAEGKYDLKKLEYSFDLREKYEEMILNEFKNVSTKSTRRDNTSSFPTIREFHCNNSIHLSFTITKSLT